MLRPISLVNEFRRKTLFSRTLILIITASVFYLFLIITLIILFVVLPVKQQAAEELAHNLVQTAHTWVSLSDEKRTELEEFSIREHKFWIYPNPPEDIVKLKPLFPFLNILKRNLFKQTGNHIDIFQHKHNIDELSYLIVLSKDNQDIAIEFEFQHLDFRPPTTLLLIFSSGFLIILFTAAFFIKRLTLPLNKLAETVEKIGRREKIIPLTVSKNCPCELRTLIESFNKMNGEIDELITNRTTLLAGISHDLRSPLTRMEVAIEILKEDANPILVKNMQKDIQQMNNLIGLFLGVSRGLNEEKSIDLEICSIVSEVVDELNNNGNEIIYEPLDELIYCHFHPIALRRIVQNLLENAISYSEETVEIICNIIKNKDKTFLQLNICDKGPGMSEEERIAVFRPFYRLENSRNEDTGGSGLGLSIVKQLADANNCKVLLLPREGGGTCAQVELQLLEQ